MPLTKTLRVHRWPAPALVLGICALLVAATRQQTITIWLAGDSTAAQKLPEKRPETGWGEMLGQYFEPAEVRVANRAMNGRSTKSFIAEGRWKNIVDSVAAGDYVFIQFGHNDESKEKGERYTPPDSFRINLRRMVDDIRRKGAFPVLFTPVRRRKFNAQGRLEDTHGEYPDLTRRVAREAQVPLIDMHRSSAAILESYGADSSAKLFLQLEKGENANYPDGIHDNTHFRPLGAELMARAAIEEIGRVLPELGRHLKK